MKFKKIYIEITNRCNLQCPFCSVDNLVPKEMNLEEFEYILKQIDVYTDYVYLHVKGEPLLHSQFKEILFLCKKYHKKVNLTTNGVFLEKQVSAILASGVVRQINISLHASYPKEEPVLMQIFFATTKLLENASIEIVYRFWALPKNNLFKHDDKIDKIAKYFKLSLEKKAEMREKENIILKNHLYLNKEQEFEWPNLQKSNQTQIGTCYGTRKHLAILSDGRVIPCCLDSKGIITLGNIFQTSFKEILDTERYKNIKKNFENRKLIEPLCQKCTYRFKFEKQL